jgi:hypothetical protein
MRSSPRVLVLVVLVVLGCGSRSGEPPPTSAPLPRDAAPPVVASSAPAVSAPATEDERARAAAILRAPQRDAATSFYAEKAAAMAALGDRALPALAALLTDDELGDAAAATMLALDEPRGAPLVFASMPRSDRNVQFHTFKEFVRRIEAGESICCSAEMYEAAVRCLRSDTPADAAEVAIYAIGLLGGPADYALLEGRFAAGHEVPIWRERLQNAASAALARLGDAGHLARIERELAAPMPTQVTSDQARALANVIDKAGFSGKASFAPALCRYLDAPSPRDFGDDIPPMPPVQAARALARVVDRRTGDGDIARWKTWCASAGKAGGAAEPR